ncbi:MAG: hypothetical protein KGN79_14595 [Acidobacteriota bacterium]|nr:hypothetical protein [Acidobacteriota bacterium]
MWIQDEQTVSFQPIGIWIDHSWLEKLFVLGLFALFVFVVIRDVRLAIRLWKLRKLERAQPLQIAHWRAVWDQSNWHAQILTKLSIFVFFVSLFMFSVVMTESFSAFSFQKSTALNWVVIYLSQELPEFSFGMLVCSMLYGSGFFFESRLHRRKLAFESLRNKSAPSEN